MGKAMIEATEKQLGLLWHTLGLFAEHSDRRSISRNQFFTSPGLRRLQQLGCAGGRRPDDSRQGPCLLLRG